MMAPDAVPPEMESGEALAVYAAFFEALSTASLHRLEALCAPDVQFRDPFNDTRGVAPFRAVLAKMFEDLAEPRFTVTDQAVGDQACYLRWIFTFASAGSSNGLRRIAGVSEIHFDATGKVIAHIDHWDAAGQIYERVPLLGSLVRMVRRQLSVGG